MNSDSGVLEKWTESDFGDLEQRVLAKIKGQKVDLATAIAEYKQTVDLVTGAAQNIYAVYQSFRSGRAPADIARALANPRNRNGRNLANNWLQYQYGLKPLVSDIYGSAEALRDVLARGKTFKVSVSDHQSAVREKTYTLGSSLSQVELNRRVTARYKVSSQALKSLAEVGITNPAVVVWELIPYSFVIDWMLPVGDWLSSLNALSGVEDLIVHKGGKRVATNSFFLHGSDGNGRIIGSTISTQFKTDTRRFAGGGLGVGWPRFKNPVSIGHLLNAMALLRQLKS